MGLEQWHVADTLKIPFLGHMVSMKSNAGGLPCGLVLLTYTELLLETNAERTGLYWNLQVSSVIQC